MESQVQNLKDGKLALTVSVARDELKTYIDRVQAQALSELHIDGFRKGKVPNDMGQQHLDQAKVLQAALQDALEGTLNDIIAQHQYDVFRISDLKIEENSVEKLCYAVHLTLYPEIVLPEDLSVYKVKRRHVDVTDADVQETLTVLQDSRATFTAKDTPAQTGDRVEVDFMVRQDGNVIEGGDSKNHPLIIGGKNFIPGFEDQLVGMKKGETKEFSLTAPSDYYVAKIAGKRLDFSVTIKTVQSVQKPELTNALAQQLGTFQNLSQLKSGIKEGIAAEKRQKEQQRVRLAVLDAIMHDVKITLPRSFIEEQLDVMVANFERDLIGRGMELGMYLAQVQKTHDTLRDEWKAEAERQAKISLIVHTIARTKHLAPAPEELAQALQENIQALIARGTITPDQIDLGAARRAIADQLTNEKALDYIEKTCVQ